MLSRWRGGTTLEIYAPPSTTVYDRESSGHYSGVASLGSVQVASPPLLHRIITIL